MRKRDLIIVTVVVFLDLGTKALVQANFSLHQSTEIIKGFFSLTYAKNTGAAWSLFSGRIGVLTLISAIGSIAFYWMYKKTEEKDRISQMAIALMLAGALGNFYDRLVIGYVRDFLDFVILGYDFPVFNVADMSLCIGVVILIIKTLLEKDEKHGKEKLGN